MAMTISRIIEIGCLRFWFVVGVFMPVYQLNRCFSFAQDIVRCFELSCRKRYHTRLHRTIRFGGVFLNHQVVSIDPTPAAGRGSTIFRQLLSVRWMLMLMAGASEAAAASD